jgi:NAD(P)-dependent dehydrogenase (short-subunit alcohol dehydrogenase family)
VQPGAKGAAVSNSEVKDNVAIVTGAAGGLDFGIAARLAEEQAGLLTDINAKLLGEAAAKLAANGATVAHVTCDVSDRASVQAAFAAAEDQLGKASALANVAGNAHSQFHNLSFLVRRHLVRNNRSSSKNCRPPFFLCNRSKSERNRAVKQNVLP